MWVVDESKKQARDALIQAIEQVSAGCVPLENEVHGMISALDAAVGGAPSGMDQQMIGDCQRAIQSVSDARKQLSDALELAWSMNIRTWVDEYDIR